MADVIKWMLRAVGVTHLAHNLDDFILLQSGHIRIQRDMQMVLEEHAAVGVGALGKA